MTKKILLFAILSGLVTSIYAQCPDGIEFNTQAEIDAFPVDYPGCTEILLYLDIAGDDIVNLNGLSGIQFIGQGLYIYDNPVLSNLTGLENLDSIAGGLWISNNSALEALTGLENLHSIGGGVRIEENLVLSSLTALSNLQTIGDDFGIFGDSVLTSLTGLENLTFIGGDLELKGWFNSLPAWGYLYFSGSEINIGSKRLTNLAGLGNFSSLGPNIIIQNCDSLTSLAGLEQLDSMPGSLAVNTCPALTNLAALENLTYAGNLNIGGNSGLVNLAGLENLRYAGSFNISGSYGLTSLAGLDNLKSVGNLYINHCIDLLHLTGLENLNSVEGLFEIKDNDDMISLSGLENLTSIGGDLVIQGGFELTDLTGLDSLAFVGGNLQIGGNFQLTDLSGIDNLELVGGNLEVYSNYNLESLHGLEKLNSVYGDINITDNIVLSACSNTGICNALANSTGATNFEDNNAGCNTLEEVVIGCSPLVSQVTGLVYADLDCNNIFNGNDAVLSDHLLTGTDNSLPFAFTNSAGIYTRLLPPLTTTGFRAGALPGYSVFPDSQTVVTDGAVITYSGYDFHLCPDSQFHNLKVTLVPYTPPVPGFNVQYLVCVENTGTYLEDAVLTFDLSDALSDDYLTIVDVAGGVIDDGIITWTLNNIPVFTPECFTVTMQVSATTPLGTILLIQAQVEGDDGIIETSVSDNTVALAEGVVGSFDPNDKTVNQTYVDPSQLADGARLEYLIRFQNTGTFPATFIEVLDTLESNLDIRTFEMISASHPYTLSFPANNILKWRFDNIDLPDSSSNELESHGFVNFSIRTIPGLSLTDVVSNTAAIYFDFNEPVITNTATTSFFVGVKEVAGQNKLQLSAVPNPTDDITTLHFSLPEASDCRIVVSNTQGVFIKSVKTGYRPAGANSFPLDLTGLPAGVYLVQVKTDDGTGISKVVKQ